MSNLTQHVEQLAKSMQCNCDLDNWQPEASTGHSWVCRIHKGAIEAARRELYGIPAQSHRELDDLVKGTH